MAQYYNLILTLDQMKTMIRDGIQNYGQELDELRDQLLIELDRFFQTGVYNNEFVDYFIGIIVKVLNIHLGVIIVDETNSEFTFQFSKHDNRVANLLILMKEIIIDGQSQISAHYKLIIPSTDRINFTATRFSSYIGLSSSNIQSVSSITITPINRNQGISYSELTFFKI